MNAQMIHVGRRVHFSAGYGGISNDGVIFRVIGEPNHEPPRSIVGGIGRVIRPNDCKVDVVLFDGRILRDVHQCSIDRPGIGIKLLERVHGEGMIEVSLRRAAERAAAEELAKHKAAADFEAAEAARVIENPPVFYWNGIKDAKGDKLQKCHYSESSAAGYPDGTIIVYARDYARFSAKVAECFAVENDTDSMVDYFDSDSFYVIPAHPLYPAVKAAMDACAARYRARKR